MYYQQEQMRKRSSKRIDKADNEAIVIKGVERLKNSFPLSFEVCE